MNNINVSQELYDSLKRKYEADIQTARATLCIYFTNSVGIGEHPQQLEEMDKKLEELASAQDKLEALLINILVTKVLLRTIIALVFPIKSKIASCLSTKEGSYTTSFFWRNLLTANSSINSVISIILILLRYTKQANLIHSQLQTIISHNCHKR